MPKGKIKTETEAKREYMPGSKADAKPDDKTVAKPGDKTDGLKSPSYAATADEVGLIGGRPQSS